MAKLEKKPVKVKRHKRKNPKSSGYHTVREHTRKQGVRVDAGKGGPVDSEEYEPREPRKLGVVYSEDESWTVDEVVEKVSWNGIQLTEKAVREILGSSELSPFGKVVELLCSSDLEREKSREKAECIQEISPMDGLEDAKKQVGERVKGF